MELSRNKVIVKEFAVGDDVYFTFIIFDVLFFFKNIFGSICIFFFCIRNLFLASGYLDNKKSYALTLLCVVLFQGHVDTLIDFTQIKIYKYVKVSL